MPRPCRSEHNRPHDAYNVDPPRTPSQITACAAELCLTAEQVVRPAERTGPMSTFDLRLRL